MALLIRANFLLQVGITYNVLVEGFQRDSSSRPQRDAIHKLIDTTRSVVMQKFRNLTRLNDNQQKSLISAIDGIDNVVWPVERYSYNTDFLYEVYGDAVNNTFGFFGHWLTSRKQWQIAFVKG